MATIFKVCMQSTSYEKTKIIFDMVGGRVQQDIVLLLLCCKLVFGAMYHVQGQILFILMIHLLYIVNYVCRKPLPGVWFTIHVLLLAQWVACFCIVYGMGVTFYVLGLVQLVRLFFTSNDELSCRHYELSDFTLLIFDRPEVVDKRLVSPQCLLA